MKASARPSPGPVAMAAFDDGYLVPTEFEFEGEHHPDQLASDHPSDANARLGALCTRYVKVKQRKN
jgi:hypothetical protein